VYIHTTTAICTTIYTYAMYQTEATQTQWVKVKLQHSDAKIKFNDSHSALEEQKLLLLCETLLGPNFLLYLSVEAQREISALAYVLGYDDRELAKVMERAEKDSVPVLVRMRKLFQMYDDCLACGGVEDIEFQKRKEEKRLLLGHVVSQCEDNQ